MEGHIGKTHAEPLVKWRTNELLWPITGWNLCMQESAIRLPETTRPTRISCSCLCFEWPEECTSNSNTPMPATSMTNPSTSKDQLPRRNGHSSQLSSRELCLHHRIAFKTTIQCLTQPRASQNRDMRTNTSWANFIALSLGDPICWRRCKAKNNVPVFAPFCKLIVRAYTIQSHEDFVTAAAQRPQLSIKCCIVVYCMRENNPSPQ